MDEKWQAFQRALRQLATPETMREAALRFRELQPEEAAKLAAKGRSKPYLVSLGLNKPYPTAIPLEKIPEELERNPAFFEHMRKVVGGR